MSITTNLKKPRYSSNKKALEELTNFHTKLSASVQAMRTAAEAEADPYKKRTAVRRVTDTELVMKMIAGVYERLMAFDELEKAVKAINEQIPVYLDPDNEIREEKESADALYPFLVLVKESIFKMEFR